MPPAPTSDQYQNVLRFVRRRVGHVVEAEELTQDVFTDFAVALRRSATAAPPALGWLYTVAERRIIDHLRRRGRRPSAVPLELVGELAATRRYGDQIAGALRIGLERLNDQQQQVVVGRLLQGASFAELAASLDISEEACRMRFMRGLKNLRAHLEQEGVLNENTSD